jgi:hypothetical protein
MEVQLADGLAGLFGAWGFNKAFMRRRVIQRKHIHIVDISLANMFGFFIFFLKPKLKAVPSPSSKF